MTLPASVISELRAHWRAQNEQRLALGIGQSTPRDLVFPAWDGRPLMPNTLSREWSRAITAIGGRKVSLHALRHTHASSLIAAGVDILTVPPAWSCESDDYIRRVWSPLREHRRPRCASH